MGTYKSGENGRCADVGRIPSPVTSGNLARSPEASMRQSLARLELAVFEQHPDLREDFLGVGQCLPSETADPPALRFEQSLTALLGLDGAVDGVNVGAVLASTVEFDADPVLRNGYVDEVPLVRGQHWVLSFQTLQAALHQQVEQTRFPSTVAPRVRVSEHPARGSHMLRPLT